MFFVVCRKTYMEFSLSGSLLCSRSKVHWAKSIWPWNRTQLSVLCFQSQDTNLLGFCSPARIVSNRVFWLNYFFCASVLQLLLFTMNYLCSSSNSCSSKDARRSRAAAKVLKDGFLFKEKPPPPLPEGNISRLWFDQHLNVHLDVSVHSVLLLLQHLFSLQLQRKVKNGEKSMEDRNKTTTTRVSHCRGIR